MRVSPPFACVSPDSGGRGETRREQGRKGTLSPSLMSNSMMAVGSFSSRMCLALVLRSMRQLNALRREPQRASLTRWSWIFCFCVFQNLRKPFFCPSVSLNWAAPSDQASTTGGTGKAVG